MLQRTTFVFSLAKLKKILPYTNSRIITRFARSLRYENRKIFYRNSAINLLLGYRTFYVHKGMLFKPARTNYFDLTTKFGTFTINRKPLAHPIKKVKKKKRLGKIKFNGIEHNNYRKSPLYPNVPS